VTLAPRVGTDRGAERVGATRHEGAADGSADGGGLSARALLGVLVAAAVLLPLLSWAVGLYDRATHWGKFVHGVEGLLVALIVGLLLFGWRDHERIDLTDELTALVTMFAGILFGVVWELVEFIRDWSFYSDVQKSNSDTMTDFLWNDVGAVIGAVLAARLYCHLLAGRERHVMGRTAARLFDGPSRVLDQHGVLVTIVVSALAAASVLAVWFASRPLPGFGVS
jgi:hypothetical protein